MKENLYAVIDDHILNFDTDKNQNNLDDKTNVSPNGDVDNTQKKKPKPRKKKEFIEDEIEKEL